MNPCRPSLIVVLCLMGCPTPPERLPSTYLDISVGDESACGVAQDHSLWCWGADRLEATFTTTPRRIGTETNWAAVNVLPWGNCARKQDGSLWCWGNDDTGTLGLNDGEHEPRFSSPQWVAGIDGLIALAGSDTVTCGVRDDGTLWCWGDGTNGPRFVHGPRPLRVLRPIRVGTDSDWKDVAVDSTHLCGIKRDGTLWCESSVDQLAFQRLGAETSWTSLASSRAMICGTQQTGELWCFPGGTPTRVQADAPWRTLAIGTDFFCGIHPDGTLWCWGGNEMGQLADEKAVTTNTPMQVGAESDWEQISAGRLSVCARRTKGAVWCWGNNAQGTLGDGAETPFIPVPVGSGKQWTSVSAGSLFSCALDSDGLRWCWGGEFNLGTPAWTRVTQLPTLASAEGWRSYRIKGATGVGVRADGTLDGACLGSPVRDTSEDWASVAAGDSFFCGLKTTGVIACVGDNEEGQLGIGGVPKTSAQLLPLDGAWTSIAAGSDDACALKPDGTLWCWGDNGRNGWAAFSQTETVLPQRVDGITDVTRMAPGDGWNCAITTDGSLWCWGANGPLSSMGSAGHPVVIPGASSWTRVSLAHDHGCAVGSDGSLWCFGGNESGQLGDGTMSPRSEPVRVVGNAWREVSTADGISCGIKNDASLWCWGSNLNGRRGDGSAWRAIPRPVASGVSPTERKR